MFVSRLVNPIPAVIGEYAISGGLLAITILVLIHLLPRPSPFQRIGKPWLLSFLNGKSAMTFTMVKHANDGYTKVIKRAGVPFIMKWWAVDHVFLPPRYLRDLQRADSGSLSFSQTISDAFTLHASVGDSYCHSLMVDVVAKGINTRLAQLVPILNEECDYAMTEEIGSPQRWKAFSAATLISKITHRATSRIIVGQELCRNDRYLAAAQNLLNFIFINGLVISMLPLGPLRRSLSYPLSVFHRVRLRQAMREILPTVQARCDEYRIQRQAKEDNQRSDKLDGIEWSIELAQARKEEPQPERIAATLLHTAWAGSPSTAGLITQMVFQVLLEPQCLEPLRTEAETAFRTFGFTDVALGNMVLMDSFIRETNRLYPTGAVTCGRTVMDQAGFRFHDGFELPSGTKIAVPALAIQTDPDHFDDPFAFNGFRFADRAAKGGSSASTVSETNLAFGYGKHSCIGRFYAVRKAKLIFAKLMTEFDMKWEGVKTRPPSLSLNAQLAPNQHQKIFLRKRNT